MTESRASPGTIAFHVEPVVPEPPPTRHPLGRGADPATTYRTVEIRNVLVANLRLYYLGSLTGETGTASYGSRDVRSPSRGIALGAHPRDELVTRLEIGLALEALRSTRPEAYTYLLLYVKGDQNDPEDERRPLSKVEIARRTRHTERTIRRHIEDALDFMIDIIWRDE